MLAMMPTPTTPRDDVRMPPNLAVQLRDIERQAGVRRTL
jgi:hypothetical protein